MTTATATETDSGIETVGVAEMLAERKEMPNVLAPAREGVQAAGKGLWIASDVERAIAQNLIDAVADHRHLREARICLLFRGGLKPDADGLVSRGKPRKSNLLMRLGLENVDFVIELNAETWPLPCGEPDAEFAAEAEREAVAVIDHELSHCAAAIAGRWVRADKLLVFAEAVGEDLVEITDRIEGDRTLVRYLRRRGELKPLEAGWSEQPYAWRIRKHDVEEFSAVVGRWGAWDTQIRALYDVLETGPLGAGKPAAPLFEGIPETATELTVARLKRVGLHARAASPGAGNAQAPAEPTPPDAAGGR